ncbi:MAG: PIG-L family deacetylase [Nanoarchaeota archaeon]|nr:PIG-L family deacetylase [Nanoarchaeota archaeon]
MGEKYTDHIIVSPHMDDAFLMHLGYMLFLTGNDLPVHVIDCFTKTNYAPGTREDPTKVRAREERLCAELAGCVLHDLEMKDAPFRNKEMYGKHNIRVDCKGVKIDYFMSSSVNHERATVDELKQKLEEKISEIGRDSIILFPMAIGRHIDHLITHAACMELVRERKIRDYGLGEDMPYAAIPQLNIAPVQDVRLIGNVREIDWARKMDILLNYQSQPVEGWMKPMEEYALSISKGKHAERVWVPQ